AGWGIVNTTALGGPSNSSGVFYSTIARSSVPYGVLGYASYESGLATAGTWNSNPTRLELYRPGVPLPGAGVQTVYNTTTTGGSTSSTTYAALTSGQSQSITPTSSSNFIRARWMGSLAAASASFSYLQLVRSSTVVGIPALIYNSAGG